MIKTYVSAVLISLILVGCDSDNGGPFVPPTDDDQMPMGDAVRLAALQGSWGSICIPFGESASGIRRLTFQDDTMLEAVDEFANGACSGSPSDTFNSESSFTLGASRTSGDGLAVNDFDAVFTMSGEGLVGTEYFDILRVDGNQLFFGTVDGNFATDANDRPQMLNFDEVYTRQ
jgi:hypothetical protein